MTRRFLITLLTLALAVPALASLSSGDEAPKFETEASLNGEVFNYSLDAALDKGIVVVYFYPSAYTKGCNIQAREFAVNMEKFEAAGASVIGVSLDNIERLNDFSKDPEYCAGKLAVASDTSGDIARSYQLEVRGEISGAKDSRGIEIGHGFAERTTFIVTQDGKIATTIGGISAKENVMKSLEAVKKLSDG